MRSRTLPRVHFRKRTWSPFISSTSTRPSKDVLQRLDDHGVIIEPVKISLITNAIADLLHGLETEEDKLYETALEVSLPRPYPHRALVSEQDLVRKINSQHGELIENIFACCPVFADIIGQVQDDFGTRIDFATGKNVDGTSYNVVLEGEEIKTEGSLPENDLVDFFNKFRTCGPSAFEIRGIESNQPRFCLVPVGSPDEYTEEFEIAASVGWALCQIFGYQTEGRGIPGILLTNGQQYLHSTIVLDRPSISASPTQRYTFQLTDTLVYSQERYWTDTSPVPESSPTIEAAISPDRANDPSYSVDTATEPHDPYPMQREISYLTALLSLVRTAIDNRLNEAQILERESTGEGSGDDLPEEPLADECRLSEGEESVQRHDLTMDQEEDEVISDSGESDDPIRLVPIQLEARSTLW